MDLSARSIALVACLASGCGRVSFDPSATSDASIDASTETRLVQSTGNAATNVTSLSATLQTAPAAGSVLVLVGGGHIGALAIPTGGATQWVKATASTMFPNIEIWFGTADTSSTTVTIQCASPTGMTMWIGEWARLAATNTLDVATATFGATSPATAGTITTTAAPALVVFGVNSYLPNTFGIPTGGDWTQVDEQVGDSVQRVWFTITSTAGDITPTVEESRHSWDAAVAAFRTAP